MGTVEVNARALLAMVVIVASARLAGRAASAVGQPRVNGEILAGILLGPSLLGLVWPAASAYVFATPVVAALDVVAQLALVLFMFLIGMELDLGKLRGQSHRAVAISHTSIIVPMALGILLGLWLHPRLAPDVDRLAFTLFMGAAMSITAFPVLARILKETGIDQSRIGALVITCAAIDDVTAWCVLAVVVAIIGTTGIVGVLQVLCLSSLFLVAAVVVVRPWLQRRPPPSLPAALGLALMAAWTTEEIGIHAIFGAFVAGTVMPRPAATEGALRDRIEPLTVEFLLPVFFAIIGLRTRVDLLNELYLWGIAGLVVTTAVVGKWGGAMLAARFTGETWRDATTIGVLMNTRGLTELVLLNVGRELGIVPPEAFTIMVLMALATTAMATPILSLLCDVRSASMRADVAAD